MNVIQSALVVGAIGLAVWFGVGYVIAVLVDAM